MPSRRQLIEIQTRLKTVKTPEDLFGIFKSDAAKQVKDAYRKLYALINVDFHHDKDKELAGTLCTLVNKLYAEAEERLESGLYGTTKSAVKQAAITITVNKTKEYVLTPETIYTSAYSNVYRTTLKDGAIAFVKLAKHVKFNACVLNEISALKKLKPEWRYFPSLLDSFSVKVGSEVLNAVVVKCDPNLHRLDKVDSAYYHKLPLEHLSWMFNRLLEASKHLHSVGVVNGEYVPTNIYLDPPNHGVLVFDFGFSSVDKAPIKGIVKEYEKLYPPEIAAKQTPNVTTDVFMAAAMIQEFIRFRADTPKQFKGILRACTLANQNARLPDPLDVRKSVKEVTEKVFGNKFFNFDIPAKV